MYSMAPSRTTSKTLIITAIAFAIGALVAWAAGANGYSIGAVPAALIAAGAAFDQRADLLDRCQRAVDGLAIAWIGHGLAAPDMVAVADRHGYHIGNRLGAAGDPERAD